MSDYDYRNPDDPFQRDTAYDPNVRTGNSAWGWIAAAVFVACLGIGHQTGQNGTNTAANETRPATQMAPPASNPSPSTSPAPTTSTAPAPANPSSPVTPAPNNDNPQH